MGLCGRLAGGWERVCVRKTLWMEANCCLRWGRVMFSDTPYEGKCDGWGGVVEATSGKGLLARRVRLSLDVGEANWVKREIVLITIAHWQRGVGSMPPTGLVGGGVCFGKTAQGARRSSQEVKAFSKQPDLGGWGLGGV